MCQNAKNYMTQGGDELVIGGKLTIKEEAEVTDLGGGTGGSAYTLPAATTTTLGGVKAAAFIADAGEEVEDVAGLKTAFNDLLSALRAAGIMAAK